MSLQTSPRLSMLAEGSRVEYLSRERWTSAAERKKITLAKVSILEGTDAEYSALHHERAKARPPG